MLNASVAIQILPSASNDDDLCKIVDEVIDYIKSFNLHTIVGPFETTIEGDYYTLMEIVKNCQMIAIKAGAPSVMSYVKISYYPQGDILTIDKKISKHTT